MNIFDLIDPAELVGVVRSLEFPRFTLNGLFPDDLREAVDYSYGRGNADTLNAAPMRAYDAEAPIGFRPGLTRVSGQLPPISQKIPLTEGDRLLLQQLRNDGTISDELTDSVFADAARMVRSVAARIELARGDALTDGIITINENGMQFTIDFGVPAGHKVTAGATWANAATDIIGHIQSWVETYVDTNGAPPERSLASTKVFGYLVRNTGVREAVGAGARVTDEDINSLFVSMGLPRIERYDVSVYNAAGTKTRVIPDDRFIMLPGEDEVVGTTQYGVTAEALELVGEGLIDAGEAPGVVAVVWKTKDPVHIWTKGAAIALPIIVNPDLVFSADVVP